MVISFNIYILAYIYIGIRIFLQFPKIHMGRSTNNWIVSITDIIIISQET